MKYVFNFKDIETPKDSLVVYRNYYWLCEGGNAKKALFFGDSPQANMNRQMLEWSLKQKQYIEQGDLQIVFVETAFVPNRN